MNKKQSKIKILSHGIPAMIAITILCTFIIHSSAANGTAGAAGTSSDPLITLSYLQQVLVPQIENSIISRLSNGSTSGTSSNASSTYTVVEMVRGQTLEPVDGSLELILRPGGTATVISPYETQGMADLTTSLEILNGEDVPVNHVLLIPRSDGRRIIVTSSIAYIMVRGEYKIYG